MRALLGALSARVCTKEVTPLLRFEEHGVQLSPREAVDVLRIVKSRTDAGPLCRTTMSVTDVGPESLRDTPPEILAELVGVVTAVTPQHDTASTALRTAWPAAMHLFAPSKLSPTQTTLLIEASASLSSLRHSLMKKVQTRAGLHTMQLSSLTSIASVHSKFNIQNNVLYKETERALFKDSHNMGITLIANLAKAFASIRHERAQRVVICLMKRTNFAEVCKENYLQVSQILEAIGNTTRDPRHTHWPQAYWVQAFSVTIPIEPPRGAQRVHALCIAFTCLARSPSLSFSTRTMLLQQCRTAKYWMQMKALPGPVLARLLSAASSLREGGVMDALCRTVLLRPTEHHFSPPECVELVTALGRHPHPEFIDFAVRCASRGSDKGSMLLLLAAAHHLGLAYETDALILRATTAPRYMRLTPPHIAALLTIKRHDLRISPFLLWVHNNDILEGATLQDLETIVQALKREVSEEAASLLETAEKYIKKQTVSVRTI